MTNTIAFEYFSIKTYKNGHSEILENEKNKIMASLPTFDQAYSLMCEYTEQYERDMKNK